MKLAYCLKESLTFDKIFRDLRKLLSQVPKEDYENSVLTISLEKIIDPAPNLLPPIIEGSGVLFHPN